MSKIKHLIEAISSGNEYYTIEKKLTVIMNSLGFFHLYLAIIFGFIGIIPLALYNVLSCFFFVIIIRNMIKKDNSSNAVILTIVEVSTCSFFSTICTGWETGFSAYNIALITACFYLTFVIKPLEKHEFIPFICSVLSSICFLSNYAIMLFTEPVYKLTDTYWVNVFFISNFAVAFIMIIVFSFLLVWEVKVRNRRLASKNEQLDELAHKDPLTLLYNRRSMTEFLNRSLDNLKTKGKRFSLILGDIDDFKKVNDTYGHDAGDVVLTNISNIISNNVRDNDYVCRWGGEEILILINDSVESASLAAERIRKNIESASIVHDKQEIKVTMTFGVTESIPGFRIEHLIQQADEKLYEGKKNGKNQVVS